MFDQLISLLLVLWTFAMLLTGYIAYERLRARRRRSRLLYQIDRFKTINTRKFT
jgi:hypothetical protein